MTKANNGAHLIAIKCLSSWLLDLIFKQMNFAIKNLASKSVILILSQCFCISSLYAENDVLDTVQKSYSIGGYVSYLQTGLFTEEWIINNSIHNRINAQIYIGNKITVNSALRSRIIYGDNNVLVPQFAESFEKDQGYADMSFVPVSGRSWLLSTVIDRLHCDFEHKKLHVTVGRQRINWGQCTVWNPNDIFNTYSFFDTDYPERAGSDAIRLVYYRNYGSNIDVAIKRSWNDTITAAALYKFNAFNYDFQFFLGMLEQTDYVSGFGTMGYWGANSIRAEYTYLLPADQTDTNNQSHLFSFGTDRLLNHDLFLQAEFLYNSSANEFTINDVNRIYSQPATIRQLSFDRYSVLAGVQYPITPLLSIQLSGIYYMMSNAIFINPTVQYSLAENLTISLIGQYFHIPSSNQKETATMAMWLLKYSF